MFIKKYILPLFFILSTFSRLHSQSIENNIFEAELMGGRIVPNYSKNFPNSSIQSAVSISFAKANKDTSSWGKYYNFPESGFSVFASNLGNNHIYGNQFSLLPYISFKLKEKEKPWFLKVGIGMSYFTTYFDSINNPKNVAIGSSFTWAFEAFLYKTIYKSNNITYRIGAGYSHASNGHTQLPNFGLNSALLSFSTQFHSNNESNSNFEILTKKYKDTKHYFLQFRNGVGFHELGATAEPVGGTKREVFTTAISGGIIFNNHLKIRTGFAYRYYEQFRHYVFVNQTEEYLNHINWSASNIYFFAGCELLMSHFSLDVSGGLNLYKPFYKEFNSVYEKNRGFRYEIKKWLNSRMGLNLYLFNTNKNPTHNVYMGAHINANFGQADFTEFNLGYVLTW